MNGISEDEYNAVTKLKRNIRHFILSKIIFLSSVKTDIFEYEIWKFYKILKEFKLQNNNLFNTTFRPLAFLR